MYETDGGVHQICINNIAKNTPNFSLILGKRIGQTNVDKIITAFVLVLGHYITQKEINQLMS